MNKSHLPAINVPANITSTAVTTYTATNTAAVEKIKSFASVSVCDNKIENNHLSGDMVIGNQFKLVMPTRNPVALVSLIERSRKLSETDPEYREILYELQSFLDQRPGRSVIGLQAKLQKGGRPELIDDASFLENKFSRRLARNQHSPALNTLFLHCLSEINSAFCSHIQPLIRSGAPATVVDSAVMNLVIDPIYREILTVDCTLSTEMVRGMLFFLTGKCHIQWE